MPQSCEAPSLSIRTDVGDVDLDFKDWDEDVGLSPDSLFDEPMDTESVPEPVAMLGPILTTGIPTPDVSVALRTCPPIPGLFFDPAVRLAPAFAEELQERCMQAYFRGPGKGANQVMLFGRVGRGGALPGFLEGLVRELEGILEGVIGEEVFRVVFGNFRGQEGEKRGGERARQAIVNLYEVGEGIGDHVDLVGRYADGIIGVGMGSGCVMRFMKVRDLEDATKKERVEKREKWDLYVPKGGIVVMTGEARYGWTHGIEGRTGDWVESEEGQGEPVWVARGVRVSVTLRWMLPGADVVGG